MPENENASGYPLGLGAQHISSALESYEAARSGFFTFEVKGLDGIVKAQYSGSPEDAADTDRLPTGSQSGKNGAETILTLNVVQANVPHYNLGVLSYRRGNEEVKFAGTPSWNSGSIRVDDVVGLDTKSILMAWQALAYNVHTGAGGRMADYKKEGYLTEYTQDYKAIRRWLLVGCWVSELSEDAFNKESDGKRQITATIQFDRAIMEDAEAVEA